MADKNNPNPLDNLKIYTYHIALFMGATKDQVEGQIKNFDWKTKTSRAEPTGYCLLNSVMDPDQMIEELRIDQISPSVSENSKLSPISQITLRVIEPGDCMFVSKIARLMNIVKINAMAGAIWGIKIKFVGRDENSKIHDSSQSSSILPDIDPIYGIMIDMNGSFTQMGSTYNLSFITANSFGVSEIPTHDSSRHIGSLRSGISIDNVTTMSDALSRLQKNVQEEYDRLFQVEFSKENSGRPLKYNFTCHKEFQGMQIKTVNNNDKSPNALAKLSFPHNAKIGDCIHEIVLNCPELLQMMAKAKDGMSTPFHYKGKMYQILSSINMNPTEVEVVFHLDYYKGSESKDGSDVHDKFKYVFDFYFAPQYNTDVLSFDLTAHMGYLVFLGAHPSNYNASTAYKEKDTKSNPINLTSTPVNVEQQQATSGPDRVPIDELDKLDPKVFPPLPEIYRTGFSNNSAEYASERAQALDAMARYTSIDNIQKTLRVRGHMGLLATTSQTIIGVGQGIWVKLNIYSRDEITKKAVPYFYQSWYQAVTIAHIFRDGKFEQEMNLIMLDITQDNK
jgi:hypothetical protein